MTTQQIINGAVQTLVDRGYLGDSEANHQEARKIIAEAIHEAYRLGDDHGMNHPHPGP